MAVIERLWTWLRENDLPNWVIFAFTAILWPIALAAWQLRRVNGIRGLEATFTRGVITIGGKPHPAIDIQFTNHTGSVVYISDAYVRGCAKDFYVPTAAARDVAGNSYHLKFMDEKGQFCLRGIILQTNESAKTCMPSAFLNLEFFSYSPPWFARLMRQRRYFVLEYTAMVGTTRRAVATVY